MQHIKLLESFVAVARSKSIRDAAEISHLTSSALNRRILDLEDKIGAPLFERHARGTRLTSAGEVYLAYALRAIRDAEIVQTQVDDLRGLRRGNINLAVIAAMANDSLMDLVASFRKRYPMVGFTITVAGSDEVVAKVLQHDADLGIAFNPSYEREFHQIAKRRYMMCAIVRSDHALARRRSISIADCVNHPLALADRSWGGRRLMDEYLNRTGLTLAPQMVSNSYEVLIDFVRRTHGVTFQIRPEKGPHKAGDGIVAIPVAELSRYARPMVLGCLRGRVLPVGAALFSEVAVRALFT